MSIFKKAFNVFSIPKQSHPSQSSLHNSSPPSSSVSDHISTLANFQNSWQILKNALSSPSQRHQQLNSTDIKARLDLLWQSLAQESNLPSTAPNLSPSISSQCLEYFFQNDVPAKLVALSLPDQPAGVKGLVINFFLSLVVMDEQFVVHSKIHKPLVRLLRSCVEPELDSDEGDDAGWRTKEGVYEEPVVELMCHLCSRIKSHPELLLVFLHNRSRLSHPDSADPAPWPPSVQPPPSSSSPNNNSPSSFVPSTQPLQRKSVHFSPVPRPSSPSPSRLDVIAAPPDHSTRPIRSSSLSSSHSLTSDGHSRPSIPILDPSALGLRGDSDMLIFSYLLRFLHREGRTGDLARAGLLFLMELAMCRSPVLHPSQHSKAPVPDHAHLIAIAFGEWVLDSDFADVLGASLGAAYGLLPSKLVITPRDSAGEDANGGMVLGGMGTHLATSPTKDEYAAEELAREERRQRLLLGLGVSGSDDFRAQMDLFLKLVEFAQDVMRNTSPSSLEQYNSPSEPLLASCPPPHSLSLSDPASLSLAQESSSDAELGPSPAESVASAVASAVLISIRKLFLNAIIYPSLLECSEYDGSAVAVMSYLEAMLSLLETDGELADNVLRFLMAEDEDGLELGDMNAPDQIRSTPGEILQLSSPAETKAARRKSGAMQLIQEEFHKAKPGRRNRSQAEGGLLSETGVTYFNSLGRFTLKDLLVTHVQSPDKPTATAALKLLHIILVRHDRYALALLDICPDPTATAFPFPQLEVLEPADDRPDYSSGQKPGEQEEDEEEEEFRYPVTGQEAEEEEEEEDDDEFVYPTPAKQTGDGPSGTAAQPDTEMRTPVRSHLKTPSSALGERILCSPCPTYRTHRDGLEYLASMIGLIDPASTVMETDSGPGALSTAFEHYLLDAEVELTSTATFRRGLLVDYVGASVVQRSELGGASQDYYYDGGGRAGQKESDMDLVDHPVIRHRLSTESALVGSLLEALAKFFVQPPELNLILTGCIATLASCPTRALDGWLLPQKYVEGEGAFEVPLRVRERTLDVDEGDDRSVDEYASSIVLPVTRISEEPRPVVAGGASVVEVYQQLAEQVGEYRRTVPGFERFLQERRQGLVFVENLEDALDTPGPAVVPVAEQTGAEGVEKREVEEEAQTKAKESFFGALFKTGPKPAGERRVEEVSTDRNRALEDVVTPTRGNGFRPFSEHYRETSEIRLGVEPVGRVKAGAGKLCYSSSSSSNIRKRRGSEEGEDDEDVFEGGIVDTPTKRTGKTGGLIKTDELTQEESIKEDGLSERLRGNNGLERNNGVGTMKKKKVDSKQSSEESSSSLSLEEEGKKEIKKISISLSMVLDNVVVLEEGIKELGAIICARKALGIDLVRMIF